MNWFWVCTLVYAVLALGTSIFMYIYTAKQMKILEKELKDKK